MKNQICTILGGGGFIGRYLVRNLTKKNYRCIISTRKPFQKGYLKTQATPGAVELINWDTKNFSEFCVKGIKANKRKIKEHLDNSLMLVTALAPHIGYDQASKIAKNALKNNTSLKYEALKTGLINEKNYEKIVDPKKMIYPK